MAVAYNLGPVSSFKENIEVSQRIPSSPSLGSQYPSTPTIHICFFVTSIFDLSQMPSKWNHLELSLWIQLLFHNKDSFLLLLALLVPLYCCVLFHFMNVPQYIYLFASWRTIELLSLRELWIMSFRRFHRKQENRLRIPRQRTTWVLKLDFHFVWVNAWLTW